MPASSDRFEGLAENYDRFRPTYPAAAIDFILRECELTVGMKFVDVGCGTGIATRMFADRGLVGIGIEPGEDMRRRAIAIGGPLQYRPGTADSTGLPSASSDLVLAAQAFHWFATDAALTEFQRLLRPRGWVALMWNDVDRSDPFTGAVAGALAQYSPDPSTAEWVQSETGKVLMRSPLFHQTQRGAFHHSQSLDHDQLLGRVFSASFAPRSGAERHALEECLRLLFKQHHQSGIVSMRYQTVVYLGQRKEPPTV